MRRRLIILVIVLVILLLVFIFTGTSTLSNKENQIKKRFSAMVPELSTRYERTKEALEVAEQLGGERSVTTDGKKSVTNFEKAVKGKNVTNQHKYAREIENIIGRLRANADRSPRLSQQQALDDAISQIDQALPASDVRDAYTSAVRSYEKTRTSWRYMATAFVTGHSAPTQLTFSLPPETES